MNEKKEANESQEQDRAEKRRLAQAFATVFGSPQRRTESQKLVLAHLEKDVQEEANAYRFDGKDGIGIIAAGIHRDGAQSRLRIISRQIRLAEQEDFEKVKPKPKVKRS